MTRIHDRSLLTVRLLSGLVTLVTAITTAAAQSVPAPPPDGAPAPSPWMLPPSPPAQTPGSGPFVDLRVPGPGRAPVLVESTGDPQSVTIWGYQLPDNATTIHDSGVCVTPCTLYLPNGTHTLMTSGRGLRPTAMELLVNGDPLRVTVHAVSSSTRTASYVMLGVGGVFIALGVTFLLYGALFDSVGDAAGVSTSDLGTPFVVSGAIATGLGAAGLIAGAAMYFSTATNYDTSSARASAGFRPHFALMPVAHGALSGVSFEF